MNDTRDTADFPEPSIPLSPVISSRSLTRHGINNNASLLDARYRRNVTSGRAAIALALEKAGIHAGDEVLIPAFHCESMVSPIRWRKASAVFYQIHLDTTIDLSDIEARITAQTKVVLATHYFGFMQDFRPLRKLCDQYNLIFIEDCAHAFFGSIDDVNVGGLGDFAIASTMKFFPLYDGGLLVSNRHSLADVECSDPGFSTELKSLVNTLEKSIAHKRLGTLGWILNHLMSLKTLLWKLLKSSSNLQTSGPASSEGAYHLDEQWIHVATTKVSNKILDHSDCDRICSSRRSNYRRLHQALSGLSGVRPLFPALPEHCVPLVYPLYFEQPHQHFNKLKRQGVPIWRFGEFLDPQVNDSDFPDSIELSQHIFQFPCHQELLNSELDWMIDRVQSSLLKNRQGTPDSDAHRLDSVPYRQVS
jgi:perosamine synthetase